MFIWTQHYFTSENFIQNYMYSAWQWVTIQLVWNVVYCYLSKSYTLIIHLKQKPLDYDWLQANTSVIQVQIKKKMWSIKTLLTSIQGVSKAVKVCQKSFEEKITRTLQKIYEYHLDMSGHLSPSTDFQRVLKIIQR